jgi:bacteriocin-like protein
MAAMVELSAAELAQIEGGRSFSRGAIRLVSEIVVTKDND